MPLASNKPCRYCGKIGHWPYQCSENPKGRYKIRAIGKAGLKWEDTRKRWFAENMRGSYACYICETLMSRDMTTLDHVKPRGSHPELKYDMSNLQVCCGRCQMSKGSKSLRAYIAERDGNGEYVSNYARQLVEGLV